ncbi:hypothetical protein HN51_011493 [Arachis hypogaea]
MRLVLSGKGKIGFIDGSLVKPDLVSRSGAYRNMAMDERYHHNLRASSSSIALLLQDLKTHFSQSSAP